MFFVLQQAGSFLKKLKKTGINAGIFVGDTLILRYVLIKKVNFKSGSHTILKQIIVLTSRK